MLTDNNTSIKVVILDAMGVIYEAGDDVKELLIPFARNNNCNLTEEQIEEYYIQYSLGKSTEIEFWRSLGLNDNPIELESQYLKGHNLTEGLLEFLCTLKSQNKIIACLSNDVSQWSIRLRTIHSLDDYISYWFISGEIGIRKPDVGIYVHLLSKLNVKGNECIFIDDRIKNLDTARLLGFNTLLFSSTEIKGQSEHEVVQNFEEAMRWINQK